MAPVGLVRPDPRPRSRAAEVLGVLLDHGEGEPVDLFDAAARVVTAYALGATRGAIDAHRASIRGPRNS